MVDAGVEQSTLNDLAAVRWSAPETLFARAYSPASDVFAFGVLLFEIVVREMPWRGLSNAAVIGRVLNGERMTVPRVHATLNELMRLCWSHAKETRPTMSAIEKRLRINSIESV